MTEGTEYLRASRHRSTYWGVDPNGSALDRRRDPPLDQARRDQTGGKSGPRTSALLIPYHAEEGDEEATEYDGRIKYAASYRESIAQEHVPYIL